MKLFTIVLTAALTATITLIITAAIGAPVSHFFRADRLDVIVDVSPWHPYPGNASAPPRDSFALLLLENPTSEKITNIRVRYDGEGSFDILRRGDAAKDMPVHINQFDFEDMKPGDRRLYYLWFNKPVTEHTLDDGMEFFSSLGSPRLNFLGSEVYQGEIFETVDRVMTVWLPLFAAFLGCVLLVVLASTVNYHRRTLAGVFEDDDYYLAERMRYEESPKGYSPSKPPKK
jgi:hypothetical protein